MNIEMSKAEEEEARLTAYVLGELDADETKAVDKHLEQSAEARASLKEIEATAALLSAEFLKEPPLSLHEEQVTAITASRKKEKISRGHFMPLLAVAACACLFAAVGMKQYLAGLESRDEIYEVGASQAPMSPVAPAQVEGESFKKGASRSGVAGEKYELALDAPADIAADSVAPSEGLVVTDPGALLAGNTVRGKSNEWGGEKAKSDSERPHEASAAAAPAFENQPSNQATRGAMPEAKHEIADSSVRREKMMAPAAKPQARLKPKLAPVSPKKKS